MKDFVMRTDSHTVCAQAVLLKFQTKDYQIVFDGELYNRKKLFKILKEDYPLQNRLEEIAFYAFQRWGEASMLQMEGAYSFIIACEDKVFAAKDPMGLSPLFYTKKQDTIWLSNRIRTLLKESHQQAILNQEGVLELFCFGPGISEDKTLFANIQALPMGSFLQIQHQQITKKTYYQLPVYAHQDDLETTAEKVHELLSASIQQQQENCQASFLSGGLDSSILTAVCAKDTPSWRTYSLDYEGNQENFKGNVYQVSLDNSFIDQVLDRYACDHTWLMLKQQTLADRLEDAMLARDLPGMADVDSSLLWLCEQAAHKEQVIFSGECSDEIFGGYPWFYREELCDLDTFPWLRSTSQRIQMLHPDLQHLPYAEHIAAQYAATIKDILYLDQDTKEDRRARKHTQLCLHWFMQTLVTRQVCEGDRANLTIRAPFANVKLLEYVYNIPWQMKFYQGQEKGILRKAFEQELPSDVLWRKKNPFPKTHNPRYADIISLLLKERYTDPTSALHVLFDDHSLRELIDSKGASFSLPWYGQLMSGPQLLAYLYQIDCWIRDYNVQLQL